MPFRRIHHQTHFGLHNDPPCSRLALCFFLPHLLCAAVSPLRLCLLRRWSVPPFFSLPSGIKGLCLLSSNNEPVSSFPGLISERAGPVSNRSVHLSRLGCSRKKNTASDLGPTFQSTPFLCHAFLDSDLVPPLYRHPPPRILGQCPPHRPVDLSDPYYHQRRPSHHHRSSATARTSSRDRGPQALETRSRGTPSHGQPDGSP